MPMIEDNLDDYRRHLVMYGLGVRDDCPQCKMVFPWHKMDCSVQWSETHKQREDIYDASLSTEIR